MPKLYITGNNADGLSCVTETKEIAGEASILPWVGTGPMPTVVKSNPKVKLLKNHYAPGTYRTVIVPWKKGQYTDPHKTMSVDVNACLHGSVILGLETEEVTLRAGDVVVIPGTVHVWKGTEEGGAIFYTIQSSEPTAEDLATEQFESSAIMHGR